MDATRTVRHLRLAAPSEAAVRRLLPTLEDALRCATLADDGPRLLVVRRLALGRVAAGISSQALARLIEQRTAQAQVAWVEAESAGAEAAPCVSFASSLQARTRLALRLLRGLSCAAWYWPLAVPEFTPACENAANLRRIASAVALTPEARVALPAWANAIARELGAQALAACIDAVEGEALLRRAGIPLRSTRETGGAQRHDEEWRPDAQARGAQRHLAPASSRIEATPLPGWLDTLCGQAAAPRLVRPAAGTPTQSAQAAVPVPHRRVAAPANDIAPAHGDTEQARSADAMTAPRARALASSEPPIAGVAPTSAARESPRADDTVAARRVLAAASESDGASDAEPWLHPTAFGGLLFLLPLLQRLGLPDWLPPDDTCFAALVLRAALQRLQAADDDPAWQLAPAGEATQAYPAAAPEAWHDPLLAPPRASAGLGERLQQSADAAGQAQVWLAAARYWLRRAGRIGLASLVQRPARLALTATHADLHFELARTDLRVRRLGLDFDPGWLPWYGRVVSFQYRGRA